MFCNKCHVPLEFRKSAVSQDERIVVIAHCPACQRYAWADGKTMSEAIDAAVGKYNTVYNFAQKTSKSLLSFL